MPIRISGTDLVYVAAPKVACTSIKIAILAHETERSGKILDRSKFIGSDSRGIHGIYGTPRMRPEFYFSHIFRGRWICVVRDPILRFLSAYANRVIHHGAVVKSQNSSGISGGALDPYPDLETFVDNLESYIAHSDDLRHHFRPIWHFLGPYPRKYSHIFSIGQLGEFGELCAASGAPIKIPREQTGGPKIPASDLTERAVRKIKRYYAMDYFLYGRFMT